MKQKSKLSFSISPAGTTRLLYVLSLLALGSCVGGAWYYLQTDVAKEHLRPEVEQRLAKQKEGNITANTLPKLSLNQDNKRQGPEVVVDPNTLGKPNPFQ